MRVPVLALVAFLAASPALAQRYADAPPRFGAGFELASALPDQDVIPDGPSVGVRVRAALPVNADVSLGASLGVGAHLAEGADDARYVLNPQASVIVTLPGGSSARYVLGGFGAFVPASGGGGGLSLHAGYGVAIPLTETSLFLEADPSLIIGESQTTVALALRAGVIF